MFLVMFRVRVSVRAGFSWRGIEKVVQFAAVAVPFTWTASIAHWSGADIMEADDRQVTTVFTVQPSFHHRHSTNRVS